MPDCRFRATVEPRRRHKCKRAGHRTVRDVRGDGVIELQHFLRHHGHMRTQAREHALWDEFRDDKNRPELTIVAHTYHQLVLNYEARREYEAAEDFYVGEMETRRRQLGEGSRASKSMLWRWWGGIRPWLGAYAMYGVLSRYGSNYLHALIVLFMYVHFRFIRAHGIAQPM